MLSPVTMLNVLGDSWAPKAPDWQAVLSENAAKLHLYGKIDARPGRKMGHINCLADSAQHSLQAAERVRAALNAS